MVEDLPVDLDSICHCTENVDDRAANGAFAAPGFADESECFTRVKIEAHAIDGAYFRNLAGEDTTNDGKADTEVLDFQKLSIGLGFG
jgi:hypothetical protein